MAVSVLLGLALGVFVARFFVKNFSDTIADDFGNIFPRWCSECGREMQVVRPGKVQCPRCR